MNTGFAIVFVYFLFARLYLKRFSIFVIDSFTGAFTMLGVDRFVARANEVFAVCEIVRFYVLCLLIALAFILDLGFAVRFPGIGILGSGKIELVGESVLGVRLCAYDVSLSVDLL